jgi:hypothetical protein
MDDFCAIAKFVWKFCFTVLLILAATTLILAWATPARAESSLGGPHELFYANNDQYSTKLLVTPDSGVDARAYSLDLRVGPVPTYVVGAGSGGAFRFNPASGDGFGTERYACEFCRVSTVVVSRDAGGNYSSYEVPALTRAGVPGILRVIESTPELSTWVVTINKGSPQNIVAKLYKASGEPAGLDTWSAPSGVALHRLAAPVEASSAHISASPIGCFGCQAGRILIFATINTAAGSGPRVVVLEGDYE